MQATLINQSSSPTSLVIYAKFQNLPSDAPIAWLSALLQNGSFAVFSWHAEYEYVWANTGHLAAGKTALVAQRLQITDTMRAAWLDYENDGYVLKPLDTQPALPAGEMLIEASSAVRPGEVSIGVNLRITRGIGQPGNGIGVTQAHPNVSYRWKTPVTYYAGFGNIAQSEYDPPAFDLQKTLKLNSIQSEIYVLLDEQNTLIQLTNSMVHQMFASKSHPVKNLHGS